MPTSKAEPRPRRKKRRVAKEPKLCCAPFDWLKSAPLVAVSSDWELVAQWLIAATMMIDAAIRTKVHPQLAVEAILRRE